MVANEQALTRDALVSGAGAGDGDGDVLGDRVVTEGGADVGQVVDVVVEVDEDGARVVGYEMEPSDTFVPAHGRRGRNLFIPRPDTLAASRQVVIVPDVVVEYVSDDLAGFGAAIEGFRARLREGGN
jgi:sporulation protein YlmC with PRC-barrel domain